MHEKPCELAPSDEMVVFKLTLQLFIVNTKTLDLIKGGH